MRILNKAFTAHCDTHSMNADEGSGHMLSSSEAV